MTVAEIRRARGAALRTEAQAWLRQVRRWLRAPRRLRFTRAGWLFVGGALAIGVAAIPTGNNLLFLLLGSMLGFIAVSGWLSEQSLRGLQVERRVPRGVTAGQPFRIGYRVRNGKRRLPSLAVELRERELPVPPADARDRPLRPAWLATLGGGASASLRSEHLIGRRGVYDLTEVTLATGFPFGLFRKERDLEIEGTVVVWPRSDRTLREPRIPGQLRHRTGAAVGGAAGARGDFRGLRDYRPGDDPRDVHWRSSARMGAPVVREYERERAETLWICVDLRRQAPDGSGVTGAEPRPPEPTEDEEATLEIAASLARARTERGQPVGLATPDHLVDEGTGTVQLERILDALARATFRAGAPLPSPPVTAGSCVLVTTAGGGSPSYADVFSGCM